MTFSVRRLRLAVGALGAGLALLGGGCIGMLMPKHRVLVDAIAAPGVAKPAGQSYRLVAKPTMIAQSRMQLDVVVACIDAGLVGAGMFEAPPTVAPDLFVEVSFGTQTGGRIDPAARETFLQLSARDNPTKAIGSGRGQELWDVRVAVFGVQGAVETVMPLLASVAAQNVASDSRFETRMDVRKNSPEERIVRETAVKSLEAMAPRPPPTPPPGASAASSSAPAASSAPASSPPTAK